jgi:hypothetical protein
VAARNPDTGWLTPAPPGVSPGELWPATARLCRQLDAATRHPAADRAVQGVLAEYADQLPLTARQIYYRLVARCGYEKTERAYKRLTETMNKARRARVIDMQSLRDDGFTSQGGAGWSNAEVSPQHRGAGHVLEARPPAGSGRPCRAVVLGSGMVPQIARVADPYHIEVVSSGGFDSLTDKHRVAAAWGGESITVLHLGDHDPSGVHVFGSLAEDIEDFADEYDGDVEFVRLAVTPDQARQYDLPSAPPKATDNRRFDGDETWQCETLDPRTLAPIVQAAIEERIDREIYQAIMDREEEARRDLLARLRPRRRRR